MCVCVCGNEGFAVAKAVYRFGVCYVIRIQLVKVVSIVSSHKLLILPMLPGFGANSKLG